MNAKCKKRNGLGTIILKKTLKKSANNNKREREGPTTTTSIELEIKEEKRRRRRRGTIASKYK